MLPLHGVEDGQDWRRGGEMEYSGEGKRNFLVHFLSVLPEQLKKLRGWERGIKVSCDEGEAPGQEMALCALLNKAAIL